MEDRIRIVRNARVDETAFIKNLSKASLDHLNYVNSVNDIVRTSALYFDNKPVVLFFLQERDGYFTGAALNSKEFFEKKRMVAKSKKMIYNFFRDLQKPVYLVSSKKEYNSWFKYLGFKEAGKTAQGDVFLWQKQQ